MTSKDDSMHHKYPHEQPFRDEPVEKQVDDKLVPDVCECGRSLASGNHDLRISLYAWRGFRISCSSRLCLECSKNVNDILLSKNARGAILNEPVPTQWAYDQACTALHAQRTRAETAEARIRELEGLLNTPEIMDFEKAVQLEAAHQRERWGSSHDVGKSNEDWFWLLGYLGGKALQSAKTGDIEKMLHHIITTAAACANWHSAKLGGVGTTMRPGIDSSDIKDSKSK